ncbi:RHS repeat-associated core domain-containing protein [Prevotella sp. P6B4]|uniref:RHS repeat-associated core domain-containing protein n=1 Tax=Prevotella sp. P6B4 TaxID=1410614 RepID=UPI00048AFE54|nr:RHS repeat-associated core domain-containing protein [Prevotella sp. P6B4]
MKPYYPFGAPYADTSAATNPDFQPYKYNGKELDKMHGLNTYDYGARQYDPILARWDREDPLAEDYRGISPYVYCGNSWSQTSTEQAVLILHSCATSEFAQKISGAQEFQNVIIIAPTENVHTSSNGDERIATTINEKTGEEVEGHWEVYLNGKPLVDESGNPITYPSDSQVGTKGFEYGF